MFNETFPSEFIGGSKDGAIINSKVAPDFLEVPVTSDTIEVYERQNTNIPFVYLQIGYAPWESWT